MTSRTRAWTLIDRPEGLPTRQHFALYEFDDPPLPEGEVRVRNLWLTVGPAIRVRMSAHTRGYLPPFALGKPMGGWAIGEVVASRSPALAEGDLVIHQHGLRDFGQGPAAGFEKLPKPGPPPYHYLNALGSTGYTAYVGLIQIGEPRAGETLFVSGAAGAVGSTAVQIGKALGLTVVGSAGGAAKCRLLLDLGADAAIGLQVTGTTDREAGGCCSAGNRHLPRQCGRRASRRGAGRSQPACALRDERHDQHLQSGPRPRHHAESQPHRHTTHSPAGLSALRRSSGGLGQFRDQMWSWLEAGQLRPLQTCWDGLEHVPQVIEDLFAGGFTGKPLIRL
jgi:NADPH-dependent curcumin reductase CurA